MQQGLIHFGVVSGALQATMAQDGADDVERDALAQQGCGRGVAEHMGPLRRGVDPGAVDGTPNQLRDGTAGRQGAERRMDPKEDMVVVGWQGETRGSFEFSSRPPAPRLQVTGTLRPSEEARDGR
jgi:hypothetical protein